MAGTEVHKEDVLVTNFFAQFFTVFKTNSTKILLTYMEEEFDNTDNLVKGIQKRCLSNLNLSPKDFLFTGALTDSMSEIELSTYALAIDQYPEAIVQDLSQAISETPIDFTPHTFETINENGENMLVFKTTESIKGELNNYSDLNQDDEDL